MVVIVDYGMGNLGSILNMLRKIGTHAIISSKEEEVEQADKLIFPGVGAFDNGITALTRLGPIPHMGWNVVKTRRQSFLFKGLEKDSRFYFSHSYHVVCSNTDDPVGETVYGHKFTSSLQRENILGVQFHPEKSHEFGMTLLRNFVDYC